MVLPFDIIYELCIYIVCYKNEYENQSNLICLSSIKNSFVSSTQLSMAKVATKLIAREFWKMVQKPCFSISIFQ